MNEIVNNFLLAGHKSMPEMDARQPGFTYSACELFTKNKERMQRLKETQGKFIKTNLIIPAFNIIWLTEFLNI